jgi:hypothetical protein
MTQNRYQKSSSKTAGKTGATKRGLSKKINSRSKGKRGELSACHDLAALFGWTCHRTQQYSGWGGGDSADIVCDETPSIFWEIKRVARLCVYRTMLKAIKQCGRQCPVILHRPDRSAVGWMLTIRLEDLPRLCHAYQSASESENEASHPVVKEELPIKEEGQG